MWQVQIATPERLLALSEDERDRTVVVVQGCLHRYFETPLTAAFLELAARLGQRVFLAPYRANGKPLQVPGFLGASSAPHGANAAQLAILAGFGVKLVGSIRP